MIQKGKKKLNQLTDNSLHFVRGSKALKTAYKPIPKPSQKQRSPCALYQRQTYDEMVLIELLNN